MTVATATPRPLTVTQAAEALGLPGPTAGARAQLLRRLEVRGVLPPARRTLVIRQRFYPLAEIPGLQRKVTEWLRTRPAER